MVIVLAAVLLAGLAGSLVAARRSRRGWLGAVLFAACLLLLSALVLIERMADRSPEDVESELSQLAPN